MITILIACVIVISIATLLAKQNKSSTMEETRRHSKAQRWFIGFNIIAVSLLVLTALLGGGIYSMMGLLIIGPVQFIAALAAAIRGSRVQGIYVLASVAFLLIYIGSLSGYITFLANWAQDEFFEMLLLVGAPLVMATIYTCILIFLPNEVAKPSFKLGDELLDDESF